MKLKTLLCTFLATAVCIFCCACSAGPQINTNKIEIKTEPHPEELINEGILKVAIASDNQPFEYFKSIQPTGFDVSLAYQIANDLGLHITFQNMEFNDVLNAVKNKQADIALSAIEITPERLKDVNFSNYYFEDVKCFVAPVSAHTERSQIENILNNPNTTIVCQEGSTCLDFAKKTYPKVKILTKANNNECFNALKNNEASLFLIEKSFAQSKLGQDYEIVKDTDSYEKYGVAVNKQSPTLLNTINEILEARFNDGTIDKFKEQIK